MKTIEDFVKLVEDKDAQLNEFELNKYSLAPWSISKLKCLQKCPFQFYLKYVLKIKVPEEIAGKQDTLLADVGSAGHRILELVVVGRDIPTSFKTAKAEFVPKKLTEEQWKEHVENLEMSVIAFQDRMQKLQRNQKVKRLMTELRLGVTRNWEATGFFNDDVYFRGIVDLVIQLENLDIIIIDHKTGGGEGSIRVYEDQLNSYKALIHKGSTPVAGAQAGIHFIRAQEVKMGAFSTVEEIEKKLISNLEWTLEGAVEKVKELGYWKHIRGTHCKYCEYDGAGCKSGELKPLELGTKKFFALKEIKE
jgi:hypothetical protein